MASLRPLDKLSPDVQPATSSSLTKSGVRVLSMLGLIPDPSWTVARKPKKKKFSCIHQKREVELQSQMRAHPCSERKIEVVLDRSDDARGPTRLVVRDPDCNWCSKVAYETPRPCKHSRNFALFVTYACDPGCPPDRRDTVEKVGGGGGGGDVANGGARHRHARR